MRIERPHNRRQAPYQVNEGHEGANCQKNNMSQRAFISGTLGYEDFGQDDAPKATRR